MPVTGKFRAGKTSRISVAATNLRQNEYNVTDKAENLDTTNFEDNGYGEGLVGIREADFSIKGLWDANASNYQQYTDPPGLFPRDNGGSSAPSGAINIYTSTIESSQNYYGFPLWRCTSAKVSSTAKGLVTFDASLISQGPYSDPSSATSRSPATPNPS